TTSLPHLDSFPTRRSSDLSARHQRRHEHCRGFEKLQKVFVLASAVGCRSVPPKDGSKRERHRFKPSLEAVLLIELAEFLLHRSRSEEHTSELQSRVDLVCR